MLRPCLTYRSPRSAYTSLRFGQRCQDLGIRSSTGSVGEAYDNAVTESFFATLECELLQQQPFATRLEARMAVFAWIEGWYNPHRRHSTLNYRSPINYERSLTATPTVPITAKP